MIVWLWDAPGPDCCGRGVTDDEGRARESAETYLRNGHANTAQIEQAWTVLGIQTLTSGYERTGQGWRARLRDGGIIWEPFAERAAS